MKHLFNIKHYEISNYIAFEWNFFLIDKKNVLNKSIVIIVFCQSMQNILQGKLKQNRE